MVTETNDHSVNNVTASQLPTITDVVIKFTTEKNVMLVSEVPTHQLFQHQHGNEQDTPKRNPVKCVDSQHSILIS